MGKENIKIVQNILKQQNKYELALKFDNAYYELEYYDESGGFLSATVLVYINANYFFEFQRLSKEDRILLLTLFNALPLDEYNHIQNIIFKIDTNIKMEDFNDTVYIFVDESGNLDFTPNGSKYFMFNFLIKKRPFNLHNTISNYRYTLLEKKFRSFKRK